MGESIRGDKSICLPVEIETQYRDILFNPKAFRPYVIQKISQAPELFPDSIEQGFWFHDFVISSKQQLPTRRIKLKQNQEQYCSVKNFCFFLTEAEGHQGHQGQRRVLIEVSPLLLELLRTSAVSTDNFRLLRAVLPLGACNTSNLAL